VRLPWSLRWAVLVAPDQRPPILNQRHSDWPRPLRWVPRSVFAFLSDSPPIKLLGNAHSVKPIPDRGEWALFFPPAFMLQTKGGWYLRLALLRWDDLDRYYALLSATVKRYVI
jgi:hypothetical protein